MHYLKNLALFTLAFGALSACSSDSEPAPGGNASNLVINELRATGSEFLELYNQSSTEVNLDSYSLADTDKTTGKPRTSKAMLFPAGSKLKSGEFVLVLLGKANTTPGPYAADACLPGVSSGCFYAQFSISAGRGETVYLLDQNKAIVSSATYPLSLASDAGVDLSACRVPDGTGDLTSCTPTPAAANQSS